MQDESLPSPNNDPSAGANVSTDQHITGTQITMRKIEEPVVFECGLRYSVEPRYNIIGFFSKAQRPSFPPA